MNETMESSDKEVLLNNTLENSDETNNDNNDDELYEQFVRESNALRVREQAQETQQTQEEFQRELEDTLNGILRELDNEIQHNTNERHQIVITANTIPNNTITVDNINGITTNVDGIVNSRNVAHLQHNVHNRRSPFDMERRPFLRTFLRNLLVLDYFVILLLFPFSLYNIFKSGFSIMTFSDNDFTQEILYYFQNIQIFSDDYKSLLIYKEINLGLLGKFHNIIIFYSSPIIKKLMYFLKSHSYKILTNETLNLQFKILILNLYSKLIKLTTVTIYIIYGFGGTIYLLAAGFFFLLCFTISIIRRYKNVHQIVSKCFDSVSHLPGVF